MTVNNIWVFNNENQRKTVQVLSLYLMHHVKRI